MSNITGFNPEEVKKVAKEVKNEYSVDACRTIINTLKSKVIQPMSVALFTREGTEYFKSFAEAVKNSEKKIREAFNNFLDGMEEEANNWAKNTGNDTISIEQISSLNMELDVSSIKEKDGSGNIGVIPTDADKVVNSLDTVQQSIHDDLKTIAKKLKADSAFLGENQATSVQNCFEKINEVVAKVFDILTSGDHNLKSEINAAKEKYGEVAKSVASDFEG